jgi:hypothetical protein
MNGLAEGIIKFKSGKEITKIWEVLDGPMEGLVGYFNPTSVSLNIQSVTVGMGKCSSGNLSRSLRGPNSRSKIPLRNSR